MLHIIKDKVFKKNIIKVNFRRKMNHEEITKLNLIMYILLLTSKKYKTNRELLIKAKELYDLTPESYINIYGNALILSFRFTFLKDKYSEDNNTKESLKFINEILFNPDVQKKSFNEKCFEIAKNQLIDDIKTYNENKSTYAKKKMLELMDPLSPYSYSIVGYMEDLDKINATNLYSFYQELIQTSAVDLFAFGDITKKDLSVIKLPNNKLVDIDYIYRTSEREHRTFLERENLNQSKLVMGYNMNDLTPYEATYALQVYLYILGLGPDSKLFQNVREKESLCYTISATAKYAGSFMMITAGIDAINFNKTIKLVHAQVLEMTKGNFKESDIKNAILSIKSSYQELLENPYSIINSHESTFYLGFDPIEERLNKIEKITKKDVIEVAKKIKINTIYLLEGTKNEKA